MINGKIIKVCGMREAENVQDVEFTEGIDIPGFIFYPRPPRYVYELPAYSLVHIRHVGVFVNEDKQTISMYTDRFGLNYIQLYGNESPEYCRSLHSIGLKIIRAFSVDRPEDLRKVYDYGEVCGLFLFGTKYERYGGPGNQFDWSILDMYSGHVPFLLSGDINSYSASALEEFKHPRLAGCGLNSRSELKPEGRDPERTRTFLNELKS